MLDLLSKARPELSSQALAVNNQSFKSIIIHNNNDGRLSLACNLRVHVTFSLNIYNYLGNKDFH